MTWSNAINQSVQQVFSQLSKANPNWIIELYKSAKNEVNPEIEVVSLLQSLLLEKLITDQNLLRSIQDLVDNPPDHLSTDGIAILFQKFIILI
ncbi:MAG: hypothetical protein IPK10_15780 [Bacteroidetes bacterium]|nr:hypothetical protein [Bacteroidota bacterium]